MRLSLPQWQRNAGIGAVVERARRGNAVQKVCRKGAAENNIPQRQRIGGNAAVAVSLRAGKRRKMNSEHTVILERTDTRKLSGSGRGRVSFQNGRKHIVVSFQTDHQGVTEAGRAGTERRVPQDEPNDTDGECCSQSRDEDSAKRGSTTAPDHGICCR